MIIGKEIIVASVDMASALLLRSGMKKYLPLQMTKTQSIYGSQAVAKRGDDEVLSSNQGRLETTPHTLS